jgi:hypothetical protein
MTPMDTDETQIVFFILQQRPALHDVEARSLACCRHDPDRQPLALIDANRKPQMHARKAETQMTPMRTDKTLICFCMLQRRQASHNAKARYLSCCPPRSKPAAAFLSCFYLRPISTYLRFYLRFYLRLICVSSASICVLLSALIGD